MITVISPFAHIVSYSLPRHSEWKVPPCATNWGTFIFLSIFPCLQTNGVVITPWIPSISLRHGPKIRNHWACRVWISARLSKHAPARIIILSGKDPPPYPWLDWRFCFDGRIYLQVIKFSLGPFERSSHPFPDLFCLFCIQIVAHTHTHTQRKKHTQTHTFPHTRSVSSQHAARSQQHQHIDSLGFHTRTHTHARTHARHYPLQFTALGSKYPF